MRRARSSQRFHERSGFQCRIRPTWVLRRGLAASEIGMRRRSPRCWAVCADRSVCASAPASFGAPLLRRKRIPGKFLSSCWPGTSDCIFRPKRDRCINDFRKPPYIVYERCRETAHSRFSVDRLLASSTHKRLVSGLTTRGSDAGSQISDHGKHDPARSCRP